MTDSWTYTAPIVASWARAMRARRHIDSAYYAERAAIDMLTMAGSPQPVGDALTDLEGACAMTARARVEQVRAAIALLTWGLS